jgi:oligoribonuclease NrnB/cAMP/cGMP phosphodiesterase (DHH superfamily)
LFNKIYILDKGLNEEDFNYIYTVLSNNSNLKVVIIDHHKSSIDLFDTQFKTDFLKLKNIKLIFNSTGERAACGLTFDYFKGKSLKYFPKDEVEKIFTPDYHKVKIF